MDGAELLVGYNLEFDTSMLDACGVSLRARDTFDVMREAAEKEWWTARQTLRENLDAALHQAQMNPQFREAILSTAERQVVDPVFRQAADVCRAGDYVIWGRDLFNYNLSWMPKDWVFPLREITFEGLTVKCPNRAEDYLKLIYGDYYRLPYDIYGDIHSGAFGYGDIDTQKKIADYVNAHDDVRIYRVFFRDLAPSSLPSSMSRRCSSLCTSLITLPLKFLTIWK